MGQNGLSAADVALLNKDNDWGNGGAFMWIFALLILSQGGLWGNNNGFANAIGYENLSTSNEVQRGFDNQNSMANQREILAAVNAGTAQSVATTNQVFHDTINALSDKYNEITRDIAAIAVAQQQSIANQNSCCCDTKMLIQGVANDINSNIAQVRFDNVLNTQKILDVMAQDKVEALQNRINQLELQQATANVVRYPNGWTYNAGTNPFCGCNCGM